MMMKVINKLKQRKTRLMYLKETSLGLGFFFNPFGFDVVQYYLIELTGSVWKANLVLYGIAGLFFGLYILLSRQLNKEEQKPSEL